MDGPFTRTVFGLGHKIARGRRREAIPLRKLICFFGTESVDEKVKIIENPHSLFDRLRFENSSLHRFLKIKESLLIANDKLPLNRNIASLPHLLF